ncbi:EFR1 family ferrodoxin [Sedimentibacter sp. MB31-C6]|uniref:EFR1 family ferrodoxin n=1 Tax=Sedimentibacter sp. MB31-C6 TaxID=3109366 RepID=UPI002DDCA5EC|nr:EFR1 family ferrodoxin [Sedimentibacter sp. MB36-C1]WSI04618.1 EFR1 family ferrodoxin [Sedimentibacter sp. MB36-C1]
MIYWFSSTGNSEHIAMRLAELLNEITIEINHNTEIEKNSKMIFVIPLYFWTLPIIVRNLFDRNSWVYNEEVIVVFTCGGYIGTADRDVKNLVHPANSLVYQLPMQTNYIVWHKLDDDKTVCDKLEKADVELESIASQIKSSISTYHSPFYLMPLGKIFKTLYEKQRRTKLFYTTDKCISCKLCEIGCPDQAIHLIDGKPQWIKNKCQHCLKCIHRCPKQAIEYGKNTVGKRRYINKDKG